MTTQSAGRSTAAPRGRGKGGRVGRKDRRTREPMRRNNETIGELDGQGNDRGVKANRGSQGSNQGNGRNQNGDAVNDNIQGDGGAIVYTCWIEKIESVQDMSTCRDNQKVKYTVGSFGGKALPWWNSYIHTRSREAVVRMAGHVTYTNRFHSSFSTPENKRNKRNESLKKNTEKRGNGGETSKDRNVKYDNKRTRTGNAFATTANPDCRVVPKTTNPVNARNPIVVREACFECGGTDHFKTTCPRSWKQWQSGTWRSVHAGHQDSSIVTGIESNNLGFSYEIEIASGKLVEIDKLSKHKAEIIFHEKVVTILLRNGKTLRVIGERLEEKVRHLRSEKSKEQKKEDIVMVRNFPEVFPDDLSGLPLNQEIEFRIDLIHGAIPVIKSPYRLAPSEMEELSGQLKEHQDKGFIQPSSSPWGAPTIVMNRVCRPYLDKFVIVFIDDILIYSKTQEKHEMHIGHVINGDGIHVDPSKIEAVKNWEAPRTPFEVRLFLGLPEYYRRFIENFSKIAKSPTIFTQKSKTFDWGEEQQKAFQTLKDKLCNAPVLALLDGSKDFVVY
nr:hypothetical protein [Tanacetum cinerariifolium]